MLTLRSRRRQRLEGPAARRMYKHRQHANWKRAPLHAFPAQAGIQPACVSARVTLPFAGLYCARRLDPGLPPGTRVSDTLPCRDQFDLSAESAHRPVEPTPANLNACTPKTLNQQYPNPTLIPRCDTFLIHLAGGRSRNCSTARGGCRRALITRVNQTYPGGFEGSWAEHHDLHAGGQNRFRRLKTRRCFRAVAQRLPGTRDPRTSSSTGSAGNGIAKPRGASRVPGPSIGDQPEPQHPGRRTPVRLQTHKAPNHPTCSPSQSPL